VHQRSLELGQIVGVQNGTDPAFLPAYGEREGVDLLVTHPDVCGRLRGSRVGFDVTTGSERNTV